jgi:hypothetical protein
MGQDSSASERPPALRHYCMELQKNDMLDE